MLPYVQYVLSKNWKYLGVALDLEQFVCILQLIYIASLNQVIGITLQIHKTVIYLFLIKNQKASLILEYFVIIGFFCKLQKICAKQKKPL